MYLSRNFGFALRSERIKRRMVLTEGVLWNPVLPSHFAAISSKLHIGELQQNESTMTVFDVQGLTSMDWQYSRDPVLGYSTSSGQVCVLNAKSLIETSIATKRTCNVVSWSPADTGKLVVGMEAIKGSDSSLTMWDVSHDRSLRLPVVETCSSMCWQVGTGHTLLYGTAMGHLRVHDLRAASTGVIGLPAHSAARPRRLRGLRMSQLSPHFCLTYSDAAGDVVKLWDLRMMVTNAAAATSTRVPSVQVIHPYHGAAGSDGVVSDAVWSPSVQSLVAVATSCGPSLQFYRWDTSSSHPPSAASTSSSSTDPSVLSVPIHTQSLSEPARAVDWQWNAALCRQYRAAMHATSQATPATTSSTEEIVWETRSGWEKLRAEIGVWGVAPSTASAKVCQRHVVRPGCAWASAPDLDSPSRQRPRPVAQLLAVVNSHGVQLCSAPALCTPVALRHVSGSQSLDTPHFNAPANPLTSAPALPNYVLSCMVPAQTQQGMRSLRLSEVVRGASLGEYLLLCGDEVQRDRAQAGYGPDPAQNLDMLAEEAAMIAAALAKHSSLQSQTQSLGRAAPRPSVTAELLLLSSAAQRNAELQRVWTWSQRLSASAAATSASTSSSASASASAVLPGVHAAAQATLLAVGVQGLLTQQPAQDATRGRLPSRPPASASSTSLSSAASSSTVSAAAAARAVPCEALGCWTFSSAKRGVALGWLCPWTAATPVPSSAPQQQQQQQQQAAVTAGVGSTSSVAPECQAVRCLWLGQLDQARSLLQQSAFCTASSSSAGTAGVRRGGAASAGTSAINSNNAGSSSDREFAQCLELSISCIAGFAPQSGSGSGSGSAWVQGVDLVLQRWRQWRKAASCAQTHSAAQMHTQILGGYLAQGLCFLRLWATASEGAEAWSACTSSEAALRYLASLRGGVGEEVSLADRLALALTYLQDRDLLQWVRDELSANSSGRASLEALALVGLESAAGQTLLQGYVDHTADLQTAALLAAGAQEQRRAQQTTLPPLSAQAERVMGRLVLSYRALLVQWELVGARVALDEALNQQRHSFPAVFFTSYQNSDDRGGAESAEASTVFKTLDALSTTCKNNADMRKHLSSSAIRLRCQFCPSVHPPLHQLVEIWKKKPQQIGKLKNEKKLLSFCVLCPKRQHLPRCYVCMGFIGLLNPYRLVEALTEQGKMQLDQRARLQRLQQQLLLQQGAASPATASSSSAAATPPSAASSSTATTAGGSTPSATPGAAPPTSSSAAFTDKAYSDLALSFEDWLLVCQRCRHGGHAGCLRRWFSRERPALSMRDGGSSRHASDASAAQQRRRRSERRVTSMTLLTREDSRFSERDTEDDAGRTQRDSDDSDRADGDADDDDDDDQDEDEEVRRGGATATDTDVCGVNGCTCRCDLAYC